LKKLLCRSLALIALTSSEGVAADLPAPPQPEAGNKVPLPQARGDWTGFYVGVHAGIAGGHSSWSAAQPGSAPLSGSLDFYRSIDAFDGSGSHFGGFNAGYNYQFRSGIVAGVEADISIPGLVDPSQNFASPQSGAGNIADTLNMSGTVRARLGFAGPGAGASPWLYYATGGIAWTDEILTRTQSSGPLAGTVEQSSLTRLGWTAGAGIEAPILPGWSARAEYLYAQFPGTAVVFPQSGQKFQSDLSTQQVRLGLNYKLGDTPWLDGTQPLAPAIETDGWALHGQTTFLSQYAPTFHTPYRGANSLDSNAGRETWDATLYIGRKLWDGAELCGCPAPSSARPSISAAPARRSRREPISSPGRRPLTGLS
jgi:high affinity Mn2+ porin